MDSFPTSSLRYGSPTHLDGLVFTLEPMTTQTQSAPSLTMMATALSFLESNPFGDLKSSRDGNTKMRP